MWAKISHRGRLLMNWYKIAQEFDNVYGLLSAKDMYILYSLYYKIISLTDKNRGATYFDNEEEYKYYHKLIKQAHLLADQMLIFMGSILDQWKMCHFFSGLFDESDFGRLSKFYSFLKDDVGIDKEKLLNFIAKQKDLKYNSYIEWEDDVPEGEDISNYLTEESILNGDWDSCENLPEFRFIQVSSVESGLKKLPSDIAVLVKKFFPELSFWMNNHMNIEYIIISESLQEVEEIIKQKNIDLSTKMALIDRIKDIQHSYGSVFGLEADLSKDLAEDFPHEGLEDYYTVNIQNKFFDYLSQEFWEPKWKQELAQRANVKNNWYKKAQALEQDFVLPPTRIGPSGNIPIRAVKRLKDAIRQEFGLSGIPLEISSEDIENGLVEFIQKNYKILLQISQSNPLLTGQIISNMDDGLLQRVKNDIEKPFANFSEEDRLFLSSLDLSNEFNRKFYNWAIKNYSSSAENDLSDIHLWLFENDTDPTTHSQRDIIFMMKENYDANQEYALLPPGPIPNQAFTINGIVVYSVNLRSKNELVKEGNSMNNCIGTYYEQIQNELEAKTPTISSIYSIRDSNNNSHVDIELRNNIIIQLYGKNNSPPKEPYAMWAEYWIRENKLIYLNLGELKQKMMQEFYADEFNPQIKQEVEQHIKWAIQSQDGMIMARLADIIISYLEDHGFNEIIQVLQNAIVASKNAQAILILKDICGSCDFEKMQQGIIDSGDPNASLRWLNSFRSKIVHGDPYVPEDLIDNILKGQKSIGKLVNIYLQWFEPEMFNSRQVAIIQEYLVRSGLPEDIYYFAVFANPSFSGSKFSDIVDLNRLYQAIAHSTHYSRDRWLESFRHRFFPQKNVNSHTAWQKLSQTQPLVQKISAQDLALLYYYEKQFSDLLNKKQSGQYLADEENLDFIKAQKKLEEIVERLGQKFYEIAEMIEIVNSGYYGEFVCPVCWDGRMEYTNSSEEPELICPECGLKVDIDEWQEMFGIGHTDYGGGFLCQYKELWEEARNLSEKIIALHYIINAVHGLAGERQLISLFIEDSAWLSKMKEFLNGLSAGDIPTMTKREGGWPVWNFQLDWDKLNL